MLVSIVPPLRYHEVLRCLLNDLARYWHTVTVDFIYKQRSEAGKRSFEFEHCLRASLR